MRAPNPRLSDRADFRLSYPMALPTSPTPSNFHTPRRETPTPSSSPLPYRNYKCRIFAPFGVNLGWRVEDRIEELEKLFALHVKAVEDLRVYVETCTVTDTPVIADELKLFEDVKYNIEEKIRKEQERLKYTKGQHRWVGEERKKLMQVVGEKRKEDEIEDDLNEGVEGVKKIKLV